MSAALTLKEAMAQARAEGRAIEVLVLRADDRLEWLKVGPRGGWKKLGKNQKSE